MIHASTEHPKPCRYYITFGECKYGSDSNFRHEISLIYQIKALTQKVDILTEQIINMEKMFNNIAHSWPADIVTTAPSTFLSSAMSNFSTVPQVDGNVLIASQEEDKMWT